MRRLAFTTAIFMITVLMGMAQKDYIAPYFSYGFGLGSSDIRIQDQKASWSSDTTIYSYTLNNQGFSMGGGIKAGLVYGHTFGKSVGLELVVEYARPGKKTTVEKYYEEYIPIASYNVSVDEERVYSLHVINVVPVLKMSAGKTYWNPYVKCGVILSTQLMQEVYTESIVNRFPGYLPLETTVKTFQYKPRFGVGAMGAIGIEWMNDRLLNIFTEVQFQYLSFSPSSATLVKARYQNESIINTIPIQDREVVFDDPIQVTNVYLPYEQRRLKFSIPMSAISISAGVRIKLSRF
jgi:hypothetical protein